MSRSMSPAIRCVLAFLVVVLVICAYVLVGFRRGWTKEALVRAVEAELPNRSERVQVESWLKSRRLRWTSLSHPSLELRGSRDIVDVAGVTRTSVASIIRADIGVDEVKPEFLRTYELRAYFFFDKQERLLGWYVERFGYSL